MSIRPLKPISFGTARDSFRGKPISQLIRSWMILQTCRLPSVVQNSEALLATSSKLLGKKATYDWIVRHTFFAQFCAGEDEQDIKPALRELADLGIGPILDYAAEAPVPTLVTSTVNPLELRMSSLLQPAVPLSYKGPQEFEANCKLSLRCVETAAAERNLPPSGMAYAAIKLTGLTDPQLLARVSALLLEVRRSWVLYFTDAETVPNLEECRVVLGQHMGDGNRACTIAKLEEGLRRMFATQNAQPQEDIIKQCATFLVKNGKGPAGQYDYLDYTQTVTEAMLNISQTPTELQPLLRTLPRLTEEETKLVGDLLTRLRSICKLASEKQVRVLCDAEQTFYQMAIDQFVRVVQREYNKEFPLVYNTYQCYLRITGQRLENDLARAAREGWMWAGKMVRGAYMVQERQTAAKYNYKDLIHPNLKATHDCYNSCAMRLIEIIQNPKQPRIGVLFGTHNQASLVQITNAMLQVKDYRNCEIAFAQLYGMADYLSIPLAQANYNVFKYVPYGPIEETVAYLSRRAVENESVVKGAGPEPTLLQEEIIRRVVMSYVTWAVVVAVIITLMGRSRKNRKIINLEKDLTFTKEQLSRADHEVALSQKTARDRQTEIDQLKKTLASQSDVIKKTQDESKSALLSSQDDHRRTVQQLEWQISQKDNMVKTLQTESGELHRVNEVLKRSLAEVRGELQTLKEQQKKQLQSQSQPTTTTTIPAGEEKKE